MTGNGSGRVIAIIELFGRAKLIAGLTEVSIELPPEATTRDLAEALLSEVPTLGNVVVSEEDGELLSSYTANLNGTTFMSDTPLRVQSEDRILVFSSQAGG